MKRIIYFTLSVLMLASCHESLGERAAREAREYTERNCPTPVINFSRTDSVVFDQESNNYIYYCSFVDRFDNENIIRANSKKIHDGLYQSLSTNTGLKAYIEAGFTFTYIVRSDSNPSKILYKDTIRISPR